ncbi:MAG: DUF4260 domain-containing protein [Anaerolineales bacterium]|nr:DUF4260 domain-containing protein [Anaerolineales bacterium]
MNQQQIVNKMSMPGFLLRIEGLTVLITAVFLYAQSGFSWWLFALLLLVPDVAMAGYAINKRIGSIIYNAAHVYLVPAGLILLSYWLHTPFLLQLGLIWLAHIGMDRIFGYGLKYTDGFKSTHMNRV